MPCDIPQRQVGLVAGNDLDDGDGDRLVVGSRRRKATPEVLPDGVDRLADLQLGEERNAIDVRKAESATYVAFQELGQTLADTYLAEAALVPDACALRLVRDPREKRAEATELLTRVVLTSVTPSFVFAERAGSRDAFDDRRKVTGGDSLREIDRLSTPRT